jgi:hypothetical protein
MPSRPLREVPQNVPFDPSSPSGKDERTVDATLRQRKTNFHQGYTARKTPLHEL